jgi:hypothetical protein
MSRDSVGTPTDAHFSWVLSGRSDGRLGSGSGQQFTRAIAELRYGNIAINTWSAAVYNSARGAWGAHPGHSRTDIQSGTGVVRNTLLFDQPQKNVMRAPFRQYPKPIWFVNNPSATPGARAFFYFLASPSPLGMMKVLAAAGQK